MNKKNIYIFIISLIISFLPGIIGSIFTSEAITGWYALLQKPVLNPPDWIFAPVWTVLYLLMAIALFFLVKKAGKLSYIKFALILFTIQLILNGLWSYVFFGLKSLIGAIFIIIPLWITIIMCIMEFRFISIASSWLMVPYLLWVSFAVYLNIAIFLLNNK